MATAQKELIRGTQCVAQRYGKSSFTNIIVVKGLTGSTFAAIETNARSAAGVSVLGAEHSSKSNYFLYSVRTVLITLEDAKIYATYKSYPATEYRFEVLGSLNAKTVNVDRDGYTLELTKPESLSDDNEPDYYIEDANILAPQTAIRMSTIGIGGSYNKVNVTQDSVNYTGYINSNSYLGQDQHTWLCTRYSMTKSNYDGYFPWTRIIELQFDPEGWLVEKSYRLSNGVVYYDQDTNSKQTFHVYGEVSFPAIWHSGM